MADITDHLSTIINGTYGEDVRQAIHDAISICYTDGKSGSTDLWARNQINTILANAIGANVIEEDLYNDGEIFIGKWSGDNVQIDCPINLRKYPSYYPYVMIYYKTTKTAAPVIKLVKGSDFEDAAGVESGTLHPVVISVPFLEADGTLASIREMHIRRRSGGTNLNYEAYYTYSWILDGQSSVSSNHDVGRRRKVLDASAEDYALILCKITGFAPANDRSQQIIDNLNVLMQLQQSITKEEVTTLVDVTMDSPINSSDTYFFDLGRVIPYGETYRVKISSDVAQTADSDVRWVRTNSNNEDYISLGTIGVFDTGSTEREFTSDPTGVNVRTISITSPTIGATYRIVIEKTTPTYELAKVENGTLIL